jgi:hypothetical protein
MCTPGANPAARPSAIPLFVAGGQFAPVSFRIEDSFFLELKKACFLEAALRSRL